MKKSQAANEVAIVLGFITLFLIVFISVMADRLVIATDDRTKQITEDFADVVESELSLAANAQNGYSRMFTLTASLEGKQYTILFQNQSNTNANFTQFTITVNVTGGEYNALRVLPDNIVGTLSAGDNFVRKKDNIVNITQPN
jgi:hypothetical protein